MTYARATYSRTKQDPADFTPVAVGAFGVWMRAARAYCRAHYRADLADVARDAESAHAPALAALFAVGWTPREAVNILVNVTL